MVARFPTGVDPLSLEGWYVGVRTTDRWLYRPEHHWKAALVYHHLPLPSGNLELFARVAHTFRGGMTVPAAVDAEAPAPEGAPALTDIRSLRSTDLELSIRVVSVRAFLRWENLLHRLDLQDLDGYLFPGQRISYGVKWEFTN